VARLTAFGVVEAAAVLFAAWAILALHYAPLAAPPVNDIFAGALAVVTLAALLLLPLRKAALACVAGPALVLSWFLSLQPTNNATWQPEYAVLPTASIDGDTAHVSNIRNFAWHSETGATPAYYDASYDLATLSSLDLIVSHWSSDAIAHVFVSFGFSDGRHLAFSVETRRHAGQEYSVLGGFFRSYELFYVVADERDLIGVRTDQRHESLYIYPVNIPPERRKALLLSYLRQVQTLSQHPAFYNTLTDNCTTNIVARAVDTGNGAGTVLNRYSWKLIASGYADSYVYDLGKLNQSMPFDELKQQSLVVRPAGARIDAGFSKEVRAGLP
jgi:hypothetical protein